MNGEVHLMTDELQIKRMRLEILNDVEDSTKDEIFKVKLNDAKWIALDALYPFNNEITELPERYKNWQVRCAIELYKLIEEGYLSYSENSLSWSKASDYLPKELMKELIPKADVPR